MRFCCSSSSILISSCSCFVLASLALCVAILISCPLITALWPHQRLRLATSGLSLRLKKSVILVFSSLAHFYLREGCHLVSTVVLW
ncbi:hypothetical protein XELAEV_18016961mg [Xenopus laevis]|uniref:Uncharacterized protein n=1 Tax=Xenopus laevis TaxID=8355 RepID=A0A974DAN1_XENLA|nr:hypothetical protein XELAEV_18016961mg [Xenopus laevis]